MVLVKCRDGEAAAVDGNAVTEFHAVRDRRMGIRWRRHVNAQNASLSAKVQRFDPADLLGNSRKHGLRAPCLKISDVRPELQTREAVVRFNSSRAACGPDSNCENNLR